MDQITKRDKYRRILREVVERHAAQSRRRGQSEAVPICDETHDNYLLMSVGWRGNERDHYVMFHLRLKEGRVWIEWDGIEYGIAQDLLAAGIPQEDIVMAFYNPAPQPLVQLAAA